jgi:adenosylcobinamide-GDP ribazoletransferase
MKHEIRLFALAIGYFTRIPLPALLDFQEAELQRAVKYLPGVGILVGFVAACSYWFAAEVFPSDIALILSMLSSIFLTGCLHEDGLADSIDGLGGGWNQEQILTIMQDSRLGSYGASALILVLLTKFLALNHLAGHLLPWVFIAGHSLSRYAAVLVMMTQRYVRSQGKAKPLAQVLAKPDFILASIFGISPLLFLPLTIGWALLLVTLCWLVFSYLLKKRLQGYTGDTLGAMQQLTEVVFYLGLLVGR